MDAFLERMKYQHVEELVIHNDRPECGNPHYQRFSSRSIEAFRIAITMNGIACRSDQWKRATRIRRRSFGPAQGAQILAQERNGEIDEASRRRCDDVVFDQTPTVDVGIIHALGHTRSDFRSR